jgi:hypothetical protein
MIENELEDDDSDQSIGALANENFAKLLKKIKSQNNENVELVKAIYKVRLNVERFDNACDDLRKLSAVGWNEYESLDGNEYANLKYGYGKLIEHFAHKLSPSSIRLNEVVEKIDWSLTHNQVHTFNRVQNVKRVYSSRYVLCTIPLGYLKRLVLYLVQ